MVDGRRCTMRRLDDTARSCYEMQVAQTCRSCKYEPLPWFSGPYLSIGQAVQRMQVAERLQCGGRIVFACHSGGCRHHMDVRTALPAITTMQLCDPLLTARSTVRGEGMLRPVAPHYISTVVSRVPAAVQQLAGSFAVQSWRFKG